MLENLWGKSNFFFLLHLPVLWFSQLTEMLYPHLRAPYRHSEASFQTHNIKPSLSMEIFLSHCEPQWPHHCAWDSVIGGLPLI